MSDTGVTDGSEDSSKTTLHNAWSIRPCESYQDEYDDCTSIKARFHQYFVHGETVDCSQWKEDYHNCVRYRDSNGSDVAAGAAVVESETQRRQSRMAAHYGNTTWKKRTSPPEGWSKPLPEEFEKRAETSYLTLKQMEMDGRSAAQEHETSYCVVM